ncbi:MAG: hypothetical protein BZ138_07715 [Methanosphaera sp. rholeuAM270]|nr:MAG: hypothetical protein BZ138_07715 [Methanosphaera sp. rholeuAM270]
MIKEKMMVKDFFEILFELLIAVAVVIIFLLPFILALIGGAIFATFIGMRGFIWLAFIILFSLVVGCYFTMKRLE